MFSRIVTEDRGEEHKARNVFGVYWRETSRKDTIMPETQIICRGCRRNIQVKDWTCPGCGAISDGMLFGTVTRAALDGAGRDAWDEGARECAGQHATTGVTAIQPEKYRPVPGHENAYRAGWQKAADGLEATADRKFGRRRGLRVMLSGVGLLLFGLAVAAVTGSITRITLVMVVPLGLGVVNIIIGGVMMITGNNDEARPV